MDRRRLLQLVQQLGREFVRRGLSEHAARLRIYYLALERGLARGAAQRVDVQWSEELVIDWLAMLRVPPYDRVYDVRPRGAGCPRCVQRRPSDTWRDSTYVEGLFPGGCKVACRCGAVWLALDGG